MMIQHSAAGFLKDFLDLPSPDSSSINVHASNCDKETPKT